MCVTIPAVQMVVLEGEGGGGGKEGGNIPNCWRNLFSQAGNLSRAEKCLKGFMISACIPRHICVAGGLHRNSKVNL